MDYETATNKELESRLAELTTIKEDHEYRMLAHNGLWAFGHHPHYCSDISATWPLMIEHGISVAKHQDICRVSVDVMGHHVGRSYLVVCKNPIRAAVICLIEKLESEK